MKHKMRRTLIHKLELFALKKIRRKSIGSGFEKGFIRAETIAYDDYVAGNGEQGAKEAGRMRVEGKEYVVADGDIINFRFAT